MKRKLSNHLKIPLSSNCSIVINFLMNLNHHLDFTNYYLNNCSCNFVPWGIPKLPLSCLIQINLNCKELKRISTIEFNSGDVCDQHRKLVKVASWWPRLLYQVWGFQTKWVIIQPKEYSKTFASFIFTFSEFQGLKAMYLSTLFSVPRERRVSQSLSLFGT